MTFLPITNNCNKKHRTYVWINSWQHWMDPQIIELIIKISCMYSKSGCEFKGMRNEVDNHQLQCKWKPFKCLHPDCSKMVSIAGMIYQAIVTSIISTIFFKKWYYHKYGLYHNTVTIGYCDYLGTIHKVKVVIRAIRAFLGKLTMLQIIWYLI